MSKISLEPNASGAGTFTLAAPNSNTNRTLNLPDESGVLFSDGSGVPGSAVIGQLASSNMPAGSVIQVVQGNRDTEIQTTSTSYVSTGLSASISPLSSTSKIFILVSGCVDIKAAGRQVFLSIFRDGTNLIGGSRIAFAGEFNAGARQISNTIGQFLDSPNTTSSVTYDLRFYSNNGGVVGFASQQTESFITLMEIAG